MSAKDPATLASTSCAANSGHKRVASVQRAKDPPPESLAEITTRRLVIFSFWAIAILLGIPVWWRTTTIYRASLPHRQMTDWADRKACRAEFPLRIVIEGTESLPTEDAQNLLRLTQHALDDQNEVPAHHLRLQLSKSSDRQKQTQDGAYPSHFRSETHWAADLQGETVLRVALEYDGKDSTPRAELHSYLPVLKIYYSSQHVPSSISKTSPLASYIANELQQIFKEEQQLVADLLSSDSAASNAHSSEISSDVQAKFSKKSSRSVRYSSKYHLTFSLFTPGALPSDWEIEPAIKEFVSPLLRSLAGISNFTVDSQVQLYAQLSPSIRQPEYDEQLHVWTLRREDLSGFINAAEWPLSPGIGDGPTLNFVLYVPSEENLPLVVKDSGSTGWIIPQWGGVQIVNPKISGNYYGVPTKLDKTALQPAFLAFSHQITSLMGVPDHPESLPLRLSTLTRIRAASLLLSASGTLGSLSRLTLELPYISIPDTVARSVDKTISHLEQVCEYLRNGRFQGALNHAKIAEQEAEKAFFDPAMVGQVYFPDEHKVAVYIPLLGPVGVTLTLTALKEIRGYLRNRRSASAAVNEDKKKR